MSDIVKWGLLSAALIAIMAIANGVVSSVNYGGMLSAITTSINGAVSYTRPYLIAARGFFNNVCGSPVPVTIFIYMALSLPFVKLTIKIAIAVYHWIFK